MKMLIGGLAAMFVSTAAFAQTAPATGAMAPGDTTQGSSTMAPVTPGQTGTMNPAPTTDDAAPSGNMAAAPTLTEKNGEWWNGDRRASKAEIAEYKRSQPK